MIEYIAAQLARDKPDVAAALYIEEHATRIELQVASTPWRYVPRVERSDWATAADVVRQNKADAGNRAVSGRFRLRFPRS